MSFSHEPDDPIRYDESVLNDREDERLAEAYDLRLQGYAQSLWDRTVNKPRTILHRLYLLIRHAEKVKRVGPDERFESDLQLDLLLEEWGETGVVEVFIRLAKQEQGR